MTSREKRILVTGAAGFIGNHLASKLMKNGISILRIDNFNSYYDSELKKARQLRLEKYANELDLGPEKYRFENLDLKDQESTIALVKEHRPDTICHLAAQAGV